MPILKISKKIVLYPLLVVFIFLSLTSVSQSRPDNSLKNYSITPDKIRYGKETDVIVNFSNKLQISRAFLSPGGPYASAELTSLLPGSTINDVIFVNNVSFLASTSGDIISVDINTRTRIAAKNLGSPIVKLATNQSAIFAITQSGYLFELNIPDLKIKNKIKAQANITDIAAANAHIYLLQGNKSLHIYSMETRGKPALTASHKLDWPTDRIFVNNEYCYLAARDKGLHVLDIRNTKNIKHAGHFNTSGYVKDIVVADNIAYLADGPIGLTILNITDPGNITLLGSNNKTGYISKISLSKQRLLSYNKHNRLNLIDISQPGTPMIISTYQAEENVIHSALYHHKAIIAYKNQIEMIEFSAEVLPPITSEGVTLGGSRRGVIKNNILYVADWFSGLHLYDITDPTALKHLSNFHTPGSSKGILVRDNIAFVGDDDHGLQIIDVKDPENPVLISELATTGLAYTMKLIKNTLYLADHRGGFHIIDISNIKRPKRLGGIDTPGKAWAIDVKNNMAYIADDSTGLLIFDVSRPDSPQLTGQYNPGGLAEDIIVRNNKAYVAFFDKGLHILDISSPSAPRLISQTAVPGNARGIELDGDTVYISAWYAGLHIYDISKPESPRLLGYYDTDGSTWGTSKKANNIFALDWWGGIKTIDVTNIHEPELVSQYHANDTIRQLAINKNYIYTSNGPSGLQVHDIKNPLNPVWVTGLDISGESNLLILHKNHALIATKNDIIIADISNPFHVKQTATIHSTAPITAIYTYQDYAYILNENDDLIIYDISNVNKPRWIDKKNTGGSQAWIKNNSLVIANNQNELLFFELRNNGSVILSSKLKMPGKITHLAFHKNHLLVYNNKNQRLTLVSQQKSQQENAYKELYSVDIHDDLHSMVVTGNTLFMTGKKSGLVAWKITDDNKLEYKNIYPSTNKITAFAIKERQIFFAGEKRLSSLTLLPDSTNLKLETNSLSLRIPKSMPLGTYDLNLEETQGKRHIIPNAVTVELPNFRMPQFKNIIK